MAILGIAAVATSAHALQRVNLTTGFSYDCVRQEPVDADHTRLYLYTPGNTDTTNFVVIASQQIASVETLPDPLPPIAPTPAVVAAAPVDVHDLLAKAGVQHNIDVDLLASIVNTESAGHANAVSHAGARGLMQLIPSTARDLGVEDATKPDQNIAGGSSYLDSLLTRYKNNLSLALAAYNAGPGAVDHYHGIPPYRETRAYVRRVELEFVRRKKDAAKQTLALASVVVR
jgi:soluble lytic murein transglycosylase-like protein